MRLGQRTIKLNTMKAKNYSYEIENEAPLCGWFTVKFNRLDALGYPLEFRFYFELYSLSLKKYDGVYEVTDAKIKTSYLEWENFSRPLNIKRNEKTLINIIVYEFIKDPELFGFEGDYRSDYLDGKDLNDDFYEYSDPITL